MGQAWFVPLGARRVIGFIIAIREVIQEDLDFDASRLKPLSTQILDLDLSPATLALVHEITKQTLSPLALALSLVIPPSIKDRMTTTWCGMGLPGHPDLTPAQKEALRTIEDYGEISDSKAKPIPEPTKKTLRALEKRGLVTQKCRIQRVQERHRLMGLYRLNPDSAFVEAFLLGQGKKRPSQAITVMRMQGSEVSSLSIQEIKSLGQVTDQTIKALIQAKLLLPVDEDQVQLQEPPKPNSYQKQAIDAINQATELRQFEEFLLFGVTGSGKTEVYLRAAEFALRQARQVLYLVPEIALTAQVIAQLRERFGQLVAVMHSNMSPTERFDNWLKIKNGDFPVVLGPRSALFSQWHNLGLIIVDEEHESSYKQDKSPRYQTKSLAKFLGHHFGCPVVYGSATPSVETYYQAKKEESIKLLELPKRAAQAQMPQIETIDLAELYRSKTPSILSPALQEHMGIALGRNEQVILFLNRRAYSPFLVCRDCGHRFLCQSCAVSLAFHRKDKKLRCHQCGFQENLPELCPTCLSHRIAPFGTGTEKVEEAVNSLFPGAKVARLDRDIARKKGGLEEILTRFRSRDIDILVGTQMVAKGLDFPYVTVVGVVAADISLNIPDFRASERTFQLLSQVAGRAGRAHLPGTVVIQTLNPQNGAIVAARDHDTDRFYAEELKQRELAQYPPFKRLVNILFTGENREDVLGLSAVAGQKLRKCFPNATILGPVNCPIERIQNLWRRHILMKLNHGDDILPLSEALQGLKSGHARYVIDVDPINLV